MVQADRARDVERLVRDYGERAFRFAYRLTSNVEDARDLVQEAYRRVLRSWETYDARQPLENWFFSILRHVFLDGAKRYERYHHVSLHARLPGDDGDEAALEHTLADRHEALLDRLEREEDIVRLREALNRLDYEFRSALVMCDMEAMSYEEISRVVDAPIGTVRSRISRARAALRRRLLETEQGGRP